MFDDQVEPYLTEFGLAVEQFINSIVSVLNQALANLGIGTWLFGSPFQIQLLDW
jgi:hypothetical protein